MSRHRSQSTPAHLTVRDFCAEIGITRATFYNWRAKGVGPRCIKLPGGEIRVRRIELDNWLANLEDDAS